MLLFIFSIDINSTAMLLAFVPCSNIPATIGPFKSTFSLLHVIYIFTNVFTSIWPCECAISLHLVVAPLSREDATICPLIDSCSVDVVIIEVTSVGAVISPCELSLAMLLSLQVLTLI